MYIFEDANLAAGVSIDISDVMTPGQTALIQYWVGVKVPEAGAGYSFDATVEDPSTAQSTLSGGVGDGGATAPAAASIQGVFSFHRGSYGSAAHFDIGYFSPLGSFRYDYRIAVDNSGA